MLSTPVPAVSVVIAERFAMPRTDAQLIVASHEPEAFAGLFDRYAGMLYRYVGRRVGSEVADDLAGETFLIAFRRRHPYDSGHAGARPGLFGIVTKPISRHRRTEAARYRAVARRPREVVTEGPADRVAVGVSAAATREQRKHLHDHGGGGPRDHAGVLGREVRVTG